MPDDSHQVPLPRREYGENWPKGFYNSVPVYRGVAPVPVQCRVDFCAGPDVRELRQLRDALKRWEPGKRRGLAMLRDELI